MATEIKYIQPEKFIVNGKTITIMSGSNAHEKELTPDEQNDLRRYIISLHRDDLLIEKTIGEKPKCFNTWRKYIQEQYDKSRGWIINK